MTENIINFLEQFKEFHFLRPYFLLFILFPLIIILFNKKINQNENKASSWQKICDKYLLPHLLSNAIQKSKNIPLKAISLGFIIMSFALSGPTYKKIPTPTMNNVANIIIISDMSYCMNANDFIPNRTSRFKLKLYDILDELKQENLGFMLFAKYPYIVSPLTKDIRIIKNSIEAIDPSIMPEIGNNPKNALKKAILSFKENNINNGIILLTTCNENISYISNEAKEVKKLGHNLFILGTGSVDGAPIPYQDDFLRNKNNEIIVSKIKIKEYEAIAKTGNGDFALMSKDDSDIKKIIYEINKTSKKQITKSNEIMLDNWQDLGALITLLCIPLFALFFKRGFLAILIFIIPLKSYSLSLDEMFLNKNQQAKKAFLNGDYKNAKENFSDDFLKGISAYKDKDYKTAYNFFDKIKKDNINALYNLGNTMAYMEKYEDAIKTYEEVLKINPDYKNAEFNIEYLKKLMQNKNNKDNNNQNQNKDNQNNKDNQDKQDNQNNENKDNQNQNNNKENNEQNNNEQDKENNSLKNNKNETNNHQNNKNKEPQSVKNKDNQQKNDDNQKDNKKNKEGENQSFEINPDKDGKTEVYSLKPTDKEPDENDKILMKINDDSSNLLKNRLRKMYEKMYRR